MKKFTLKDIKKTHAGISRIKAMLKMAFVSTEKMLDLTIDKYDLADINEAIICINDAIKFLDSLNSNLNEGNLCYDAKEINELYHEAFINDLFEKDNCNSDSICDFGPCDGGSSND